jgi:hypothetical protein
MQSDRKFNDVSEEYTASVFKDEEQAKQGSSKNEIYNSMFWFSSWS